MSIASLLSSVAQVIDVNEVKIPKGDFDESSVEAILSIVFGVAGGVALIIITIAGLQYVLSRGDPAATAKAKNAIIYALIGLIIAIFAFSIVRFVVVRV